MWSKRKEMSLSLTSRQQALHHSTRRSIPYWTAAACVGIVAVGYAKLFHVVDEWSRWLLLEHPYISLVVAPVFFIFSWWIVKVVAPGSRGSGIPQVMAAIQSNAPPGDARLDSTLSLRVGLVKIISSTLALAGGAAVGREGPTIHLAAVTYHAIGKRWRKLLEPITESHWIIAAGAAGLAAAFNTPLGGIVFALEELATLHLSRFRTALFSSVIVAGMVAQWIVGPYLYFGYPRVGAVNWIMVINCVLAGIASGLLGAFFIECLHRGSRRISELRFTWQAIFAGIVGLGITVAAILTSSPTLRGPGTEVIQTLLFTEDKSAGIGLLVGRMGTSIASYLAGGAGGIFAPSLAIGAILGSSMDSVLHSGNANLLILVCMTGFLSAVTRAPFTALVVVLEMTDRHSVIFPLMLSSVIASAVAGFFGEESFYHRQSKTFLIDPKSGAV